MIYNNYAVQELVLATLRLYGNGKNKTYLSATIIKNFFPDIPLLDEATVEKALKSLLQKRILHYTGDQVDKKSTERFYKIRIDNMFYVYHHHSFHYAKVLEYFSVQPHKTIGKTPTFQLVVNFPPKAVNATLDIVIRIGLDYSTSHRIPNKTRYDKSKVWQYLNFHQKEPIALTSIIGKTYYKSGAG